LHGHGLFDRVHVADRPAYLTALGDTAALAESRSAEFRVRRDGTDTHGHSAVEFVWIEMRCRPLEQAGADAGEEGRREVVAVLRDVTRRKQKQQELEDAHAEAKRRNEYAGLINDSGNHLLSVVNGILDMSKIETDNFEITPEPFNPGQVIASCCGILALRARDAGVRLERLVPSDLPEIVADKRALNQIMFNLLSNAIRFTDRGGKVLVNARAEAGNITFVIEDSGVGISDEDLARVGEPYFQAGASYDRRHGGTGFGPSLVKGLVRLHGGEFSIRSRVGEGTRITIGLPLDCERSRPVKKRSFGVVSPIIIPMNQSAGIAAQPVSAVKKSA